MDIQIRIQGTPNPNALKFVLDTSVKTDGNVTYKGIEAAEDNPLAKALFEVDTHVKDVYFFDNYITVTQDGETDWDPLEEKIKDVITQKFPDHNPDFNVAPPLQKTETPAEANEETQRIDAILNETIRPALQMDGGDVQVVSYKNNEVKVFYQGACGSCPSAAMGTLNAIENILKDQFDPNVTVVMADGMGV